MVAAGHGPPGPGIPNASHSSRDSQDPGEDDRDSEYPKAQEAAWISAVRDLLYLLS